MGAVEHLARLDDAPRLPLAQIDERIAAGPVDPGEAQDVGFGAPRFGCGRPARLVLEPGEAARGARQRRARLVDPFPRVIPINADGRIIDDAPERRRGGDRGREALDRRARATARRDGDDDRLGLPERLLEPRLRLDAVEAIGLDALATQRGDGFSGPGRSARLDPGLALERAAGRNSRARRRTPSRARGAPRLAKRPYSPRAGRAPSPSGGRCRRRRRTRARYPHRGGKPGYFFFGI